MAVCVHRGLFPRMLYALSKPLLKIHANIDGLILPDFSGGKIEKNQKDIDVLAKLTKWM